MTPDLISEDTKLSKWSLQKGCHFSNLVTSHVSCNYAGALEYEELVFSHFHFYTSRRIKKFQDKEGRKKANYQEMVRTSELWAGDYSSLNF